MQFLALEKEEQLDEIKNSAGYTVIFKHNTTCPISKSVRRHFEAEADQLAKVDSVYFLDLLEHRTLSDAISEQFGVPHQSPQLLLIRGGKCTYNEALYNITAEQAAKAAI
jgi:bacillithiol system protein YtxJ